MASRYLWSPLAIGPITTRNRIVFSAHLTNYARDGRPTAQPPPRPLLRGAGRWCRRADRHRGALDTPDRLAVREAHSRVPSRRDPWLPRDHRGGASPPRADLRPDQPQRWTGQLDVFAPSGLGPIRRG